MARRAHVAIAAAVLLLATACGDEPSAEAPSPSPSASVSSPEASAAQGRKGTKASPASSETPTVADPEHAVEPPGPREGRLVYADLMIKDQDALDDELIEEINSLKSVRRSLVLSLGDVGIENRVINIGAVDPSTYRNFTPFASAELQSQWDRVAGGEVAIDQALGKRLQDDEGYLKLGNDEDAPKVHIGAYAPQVPQIDAVVNEKWGEELGIPSDNAMLVWTGTDSPRFVMEDLQKIVGDSAAVSILGPDLDPGAKQTAVLTGGSVAEAVGTFRYTVLGGGRIAPDQSWVDANIRTEPVPILGNVTCHKVVLPQLRAALLEIQNTGLAKEINPGEYAGCYYPRFIANTQQLSLHSFGIALDLNVPGNLRGTVGEMNRAVVAIFKDWGFAWGGDWGYTDPMHFEMNAIVDPE
ncbi:M15 family metallopeptidase [Nocardioides piscis]|uniref:M15 family metallopeptidase n=1 Tax=Nocardioides piscis TaxID=2714938 RepID=A0A6G7YE05_9ACTN|nr:M15 family metallopeptidase [Nocardioides piscis]QIK74868.1 M15 family metallopeptidase [Nocardioides piscis]